jgi:hypothetical protein
MAAYSRFVKNLDGKSNSVELSFIVANGVTVTQGDMVYFSSGTVTSAASSTAHLIGMANGTATGNAGGTIKVSVLVDDSAVYLMKNDNLVTTFASTHVGQYFSLIGATGAQLIDTSTVSTTVLQMLCIEYNPQIDPVRTDLTYGLFVIALHAARG